MTMPNYRNTDTSGLTYWSGTSNALPGVATDNAADYDCGPVVYFNESEPPAPQQDYPPEPPPWLTDFGRPRRAKQKVPFAKRLAARRAATKAAKLHRKIIADVHARKRNAAEKARQACGTR